MCDSVALPVGGSWSNQGTIRRAPMDVGPGQPYSMVMEGGSPFAPVTVLADLGVVNPVAPFPTGAENLVISLSPFAGSAGPLIPVFDGLGLFGPAIPFAYDANGKIVVPGFVLPPVPLGISATLQAVYFDPGNPTVLKLTWARTPDQF